MQYLHFGKYLACACRNIHQIVNLSELLSQYFSFSNNSVIVSAPQGLFCKQQRERDANPQIKIDTHTHS